MKKSLIAVAALAATSAFAQSSVSIYGVADVVLHKDKGASAKLTSGGVDESRIGFKGTEDLGGGLKANFVLEQGFDMTNGAPGAAGQAFSREASLGLSGAFGAVKAGKVWTAFDDVSGAAFATFDSVLSAEQVFASAYYQGNPTQGLRYETPVFSGFSGAVSYNLDGVSGVNNSIVSVSAKYENGPLMVGFGYQDENKSVNPSLGFSDLSFTRLNASYNFGVATIKGSYGRVKNDVGGAKANEYAIGVDVPVASNVVLSGGYASSKADGEAKRSTAMSVAAAYLLSKRTTVYGGLFVSNDEAVANRGTAKNRYGVGVKHTF